MTAARGHGWRDRSGIAWTLTPLGRHLRLVADVDDAIDRTVRLAAVRSHAWVHRPPGITDVVPGERALTIEVAPGAIVPNATTWLARATDAATSTAPGRRLTLPVAYGEGADDGTHGVGGGAANGENACSATAHDDALPTRLGLPWSEITARHAAATYRVGYLGFTPGFPYLLGTPAALTLPRRSAPRPMRAGTVAIAAGRTGIYPSDGPGGWWRLGRTPVQLFDPHAPTPTLLLPGDEVRFAPIPPSAGAPTTRAAQRDRTAHRGAAPALSVLAVWPGGATLQGRPRPGVGHLGMAQAGALDPEAFDRARRLAGASARHPAIELTIPHATLRAERDLIAAVSGAATLRLEGRPIDVEVAFAWPAGATLTIRPDPRQSAAPALLAVGGGLRPLRGAIGHPTLLRGDSTDVRAGIGGFGRALASGDVMERASAPLTPARAVGKARERGGPLRLHAGPAGAEAFAALLAGRFRLEKRDRMGARLSGGRRPEGLQEAESEGVPLGAVQWPAGGEPIVLLADRGRTGGYPLVGLVDPRDLPRLARAQPGAIVRFAPVWGDPVG